MSDKARGLFNKFAVVRTDGKSDPGERHHGCEYFVLDLTHDPLAINALAAYARAAERAGYKPLAEDLRAKLPAMRARRDLEARYREPGR